MKNETRKLIEENWEPWTNEGYEGASSIMVLPKTMAEAVSCRVIKLESGGYTRMHSHKRIHQVIVLEGVAIIETDKERIELGQLYMVRVPANIPHRFINISNEEVLIQVQNVYPV